MKYFLGIDLGSSSIKLALVDHVTGSSVGVVQEPQEEMPISAPISGWAEQTPEDWWLYVRNGVSRIKKQCGISEEDIIGIGIAYQMHGLVLVDNQKKTLRKSIIWCDSRAIEIGNEAYETIGNERCDSSLLNSPSNFTASKLAWVRENEPEVFKKIYKFMLPGDYLAFCLTNTINTTICGLSEGIFWDFQKEAVSTDIFDHFKIPLKMVPEIVPTFGNQGSVSKNAARQCGLLAGTPILYRAGDQPNNALSLNVLNPGEIAATGGTSGVMYAVTDNLLVSECAKVNNFVHVNYEGKGKKRIGKLLCINGAGIQYRWLKNNLSVSSYVEMNKLAQNIEVGSDGVCLIPFGNGAERMLLNQNTGARITNLDLNRHHKGHLCRAALEGIAFSFVYGFEILLNDGILPKVIRAGNDNLFQSEIFTNTVATLIKKEIEIYNTTGAIGAARACCIKEGDFTEFSSFIKNDLVKTYKPQKVMTPFESAYQNWKKELESVIEN